MTTGSALAGLRVLDLANERAGSLCAMVLADLGADVVRAVDAGGAHARPAPETAAGPVCWDRGKTPVIVESLDLADAQVRRLVDAADVVILDGAPGELAGRGLSPDAVARRNERAVVGWFPANGAHGPSAELPADPIVLAAISGFAQWQTSVVDAPVAPVVSYPSNVQGAIGASTVLAALFERRRSERGQVVTVTGLHAASLLLATVTGTSLDQPMAYSSPRDTRGSASFRLYRCGDGEWLFLGALVPTIFLTALDALDLLDVMVLPGVDGEFMNLYVGDNGLRVATRLEARFAERPRGHWLELLAAAGVPASAVQTREAWLASEAFLSAAGRVERHHPGVGPVLLPALPFALDGVVPAVGELAESSTPAADVWPDHAALAPAVPADAVPGGAVPGDAARPGGVPPAGPPLAGLRVLDCSTFLAGPTAPTLFAQWGADVIKVEPPSGDPYRLYNVAYTAANQGKRRVVLDLTTADGKAAFFELVRHADVVVDNFRPSLRAKLGLHTDVLLRHNPRLVHTTLSAFGDVGPLAEAPGFDPVIQASSGLMHACGDDDQPYYTSTPVHDVATGSLVALGTLAALHARDHTGAGGRVALSLAASSVLVQCEEMTEYHGRPPTTRGGVAHLGASAGSRFYRVADGWIALVCEDTAALRSWSGALDRTDADVALAVAARVGDRTADDAVRALRDAGIPAVRVVERDELTTDPHLVAHDLRHAVRDAEIGRCLVVGQVAVWSRSTPIDTIAGPAREPDAPGWLDEPTPAG